MPEPAPWLQGLPDGERTCEVRCVAPGSARQVVVADVTAEVVGGLRTLRLHANGERFKMAFRPGDCEWRPLPEPVLPPACAPPVLPRAPRGAPERVALAGLVREARRCGPGTRLRLLMEVLENGCSRRVLWLWVPRCACGRRNGPRSHVDVMDDALPWICWRCYEVHPSTVTTRALAARARANGAGSISGVG